MLFFFNFKAGFYERFYSYFDTQTIIRSVKTFIEEHGESVVAANSDLDKTASLVVASEIIGKEPIAKKAIPLCNVVCMTGDSVKNNLAPYLEVLYNSDPKSVGGKLPGDDFYFKG